MVKTVAKYFYIWLLIALSMPSVASAQNNNVLQGVVEDVQGKPIQFATVKLNADDMEVASRSTNAKGEFVFPADFLNYDSVQIVVSFVNKATQSVVVKRNEFYLVLKITLPNLSL